MCPGADPVVGEVVGEAVGPLVEPAVGQAVDAGHQGQPVGHGVHHHLEQVGQVELGGHSWHLFPSGPVRTVVGAVP